MIQSLFKLFRTTAGRTARRYALYTTLVLAGCLALAYFARAHYIDSEIAAGLTADLGKLRAIHSQQGHASMLAEILARQQPRETPAELFYFLQSPGGQKLTGGVVSWPPRLAADSSTMNLWVDETVIPGLESEEYCYWPFEAITLDDGCRLLVTQHVEFNEVIGQTVLPALWLGFAGAVLGTMILGFSIGRDLLSRVAVINATARAVTEGDLTRRAPRDGSGDEFDELSLHFNAMLTKTEALVLGMRRVSDNVAHDLRRPLTRLLSGLEVTLLEAREPEAYRQAIGTATNELKGIIETFNALLLIARTEARGAVPLWSSVDLSAMVSDLAELYDLGGHLECGPAEILVQGEPHELRQALSNLIENALKFSPRGSPVGLSASLDQTGKAIVTVWDRGPGIPADQREFVLERFSRLEEARSTPGNGLGLALVKAVADHHGAKLVIEANNPGVKVSLVFTSV